MRESCCAEEEACGTSADCQAAFLCLAGCRGDTACHENCRRLASPAGLVLYDAEAACRAANCAAWCDSASVP